MPRLGFKTIDTCIRSQVAVNKAQTYASGEVVGDFAGITGIKRKLIRIKLPYSTAFSSVKMMLPKEK